MEQWQGKGMKWLLMVLVVLGLGYMAVGVPTVTYVPRDTLILTDANFSSYSDPGPALAHRSLLVSTAGGDLGSAMYGAMYSNRVVVGSAASAAAATPVELIPATAGGFWYLSITVATQTVDISFDGGVHWATGWTAQVYQKDILLRVESTSAILIRDNVDTAHGTVTITARGPGA